ncbi:MAG: hypothetical protein Q9226_004214 [Calogaya cf. arnoldii]
MSGLMNKMKAKFSDDKPGSKQPKAKHSAAESLSALEEDYPVKKSLRDTISTLALRSGLTPMTDKVNETKLARKAKEAWERRFPQAAGYERLPDLERTKVEEKVLGNIRELKILS